jgi:hypothetical protein
MSKLSSQRKWLLVGAVIYGATLLNAIRLAYTLPAPAWVITLGIVINLLMCVGFLRLYLSTKN